MQSKLGTMLVEGGVIDEIQLSVALGMQKKTGLKLGQQLLKIGFASEEVLSPYLRKLMGITVALDDQNISEDVISTIPQDLAFQFKIIPVAYDGRTITLATSDPSNLAMMDAISFKTGKRIKPVKALDWDIDNSLLKYYLGFTEGDMKKLTHTSDLAMQYQKMDWDFGNLMDTSHQAESAHGENNFKVQEGPLTDLLMPSSLTETPRPNHAEPTVVAPPPAAPPRQPVPRPQPPAMKSPVSQTPPPSRPSAQAPQRPLPPKHPLPPAPAEPQPKPTAQTPPTTNLPHGRKANLLHALVDILIEKNVITEKELLIALLKLERQNPAE